MKSSATGYHRPRLLQLPISQIPDPQPSCRTANPGCSRLSRRLFYPRFIHGQPSAAKATPRAIHQFAKRGLARIFAAFAKFRACTLFAPSPNSCVAQPTGALSPVGIRTSPEQGMTANPIGLHRLRWRTHSCVSRRDSSRCLSVSACPRLGTTPADQPHASAWGYSDPLTPTIPATSPIVKILRQTACIPRIPLLL